MGSPFHLLHLVGGEVPAAAAVGGGSSKAVAAGLFKAFETSDLRSTASTASTASAAAAGRFNCFVFLAGGSPLLEAGRFNPFSTGPVAAGFS